MSVDPAKRVTAPVMRFLSVADVARSISFYRDVLGFTQQASRDEYRVGALAEVELGAARIQLCPQDRTEPSILFFETENVAELRQAFLSRGASPSPLQKVNWIKMEMFEVRDPDGNVLWFGQSFDQPVGKQPEPMMHQALPHFPLTNVEAGVAYYQEKFGFKINYAQSDLGVMYRDKATLLLVQRTASHSGIGSCTIYIKNADELYEELKGRGANIKAPPVSRPWGLRDFTVSDIEGNEIAFAQPFE